MKQWTEEELINDGNRLRNAEITNVSLNFKDHGVLTLDLTLSGGGWGVVFGGYVLGHGYLGSENFKGSKAFEYLLFYPNLFPILMSSYFIILWKSKYNFIHSNFSNISHKAFSMYSKACIIQH